MGCCCGKYRHVYKIDEILVHQELFESLALTESDVGRIYEQYRIIDVDGWVN